MASRHFLALGGYDEEMLSGVAEDRDLLRRAEAFGLDFVRLQQSGTPAIQNTAAERLRHSVADHSAKVLRRVNFARTEENIKVGRLVANRERKRRAVLINFSTESEL